MITGTALESLSTSEGEVRAIEMRVTARTILALDYLVHHDGIPLDIKHSFGPFVAQDKWKQFITSATGEHGGTQEAAKIDANFHLGVIETLNLLPKGFNREKVHQALRTYHQLPNDTVLRPDNPSDDGLR